MSNFKQASKLKLRFDTPFGPLTTEQLWDLSPVELDGIAVELDEEYKASNKKSFLAKKTKKDKIVKFKLDIVVDILTTKVEEEEASLTAVETKAHNQNILEIIAEKEGDALKGKTVEELKGLLKEE